MKAMILSAGFGERLKPITNTIPKALIEIGKKTMIERALENLKNAGVNDIIINLHYLGDKIEKHLKNNYNFGLDIKFSKEEKILETGGGLKKASYFFDDKKPFFLYNCDILTDLNLKEIYKAHIENKNLATLAVMKRPSSRQFIFDENMSLSGWMNSKTGEKKIKKEFKEENILAFLGIQVLSPEIFSYFPDKDFFSITEFYLDLAEKKLPIKAFEVEKCLWYDIGSMEKLCLARTKFNQ